MEALERTVAFQSIREHSHPVLWHLTFTWSPLDTRVVWVWPPALVPCPGGAPIHSCSSLDLTATTSPVKLLLWKLLPIGVQPLQRKKSS